MDINELIDNLRFPSWYDLEDPDATLLTDAATALSTLQAENEKLRAELERMKEIMRYNGIMVIPLKYPGGRSEEYSEATRLEGGLTMERLTERLENGIINVKYASQHETAIHRGHPGRRVRPGSAAGAGAGGPRGTVRGDTP